MQTVIARFAAESRGFSSLLLLRHALLTRGYVLLEEE
jgi:hypothetical protein